MTQEQKKLLLLDMFDALISWPEDIELISLMNHCLGIINLLCEHDRQTRVISLGLGLITRSHNKAYLSSSMRNSLVDLESESPELRGFTNLFDIIIEDNNFRIDTQDLISSLANKYQQVAQVFLEVLHNFDSYDELNRLCDAQKPQVLVLIFLHALRQVFLILDLPLEAIKFSLENLRVNARIINIFNLNINSNNPGNLLDENNLILYLCLCSTHAACLQKEALNQIQIALEQARFPSLTSFVEWGFVSIDI